MTNPIAAWRLRRAAQACAQRLGPQLLHDYGPGETYTAAQIKAAAERARLHPGYRFLSDAAFLPEAAFVAAWGTAIPNSYEELRTLLARYRPPRPASSGSPARENIDAISGAIGGL